MVKLQEKKKRNNQKSNSKSGAIAKGNKTKQKKELGAVE